MKKIYLSLLCSVSIFANAHAGFQKNDFQNPENNISRTACLRTEFDNNQTFKVAINAIRQRIPGIVINGASAKHVLDRISDQHSPNWKCLIGNWDDICNNLFKSFSQISNNQPQHKNNMSQWRYEISVRKILPQILSDILGYVPKEGSVFLLQSDPSYIVLNALSEDHDAIYMPSEFLMNYINILEDIFGKDQFPNILESILGEGVLNLKKCDPRSVLIKSMVQDYLDEKNKVPSNPPATNINNNSAPKAPVKAPAPQPLNNDNSAAPKPQTLAEVGFNYKFTKGEYPTSATVNGKNVDLYDATSPTIYYFGSWDSKVVNARRGWQNEYFAFSNYYKDEAVSTSKSMPHTLYLEIGGRRYGFNNLEAAYQCAKTQAYLTSKGNTLSVQQIQSFQTATPDQSKALPANLGYQRGDNAALANIMSNLLAQKFINHPDLGNLLKGTGKSFLAEGNNWRDEIWGVATQDGVNFNTANSFSQLGFMLMTLRDQMVKGTAPKVAPDLKL